MLDHGVFMEGAILKSNIVNPGKKCPQAYTVDEIAQANIKTLLNFISLEVNIKTNTACTNRHMVDV